MKNITTFVEYCFSFYGKNGIYDMGATMEQLYFATGVYIGRIGHDEFEGDSLDRERVSYILTECFDLVHP